MARLGDRRWRWLADPGSPEVLRLVVPATILGVGLSAVAAILPLRYTGLLGEHPVLAAAFATAHLDGIANIVAIFAGFAGAWLLGSVFLALSRRPFTLAMLRQGFIAAAAWVLVYGYGVISATDVLFEGRLGLDGGGAPDGVQIFYWRWHLLWPALAGLAVAALAYLWAWRRAAIRVFGGPPDLAPARGDRVLENLRTHGQDPRYRKSMLHSLTQHLLVIVILPLLLQLVGCVEPYRVPKGSGNPVVALLKVIPPKPKKIKKKYILNPNSAIIFQIPDLDDSPIIKQVDDQTQVTYVADPTRILATLGTAKAGKMGAGGGKTGGWPDGMENAKVRFIRMEYDGSQWDDGMDAVTRADLNFLDAFHKLTGFKVADKPESHPIRLLARYPKGYAPPFVYMTGDGGIRVSAAEVKIMREYLLEGGMLFADCGSPSWNGAFRGFAQQLFPGQPLLTIADDDPLFQIPYAFPNGAPPLWHHGGYRALGIKHRGRWVIFYHPGDINDAWKTGHSGMNPQLAEGATQMGVNIVYYSFTHYLELTRKYRK